MEVRSGYASASLPFIQKKKKIKMYNFAFSLRDHYTQKGILPHRNCEPWCILVPLCLGGPVAVFMSPRPKAQNFYKK